jgi:hypothetical protein
MSIVIKPMKMFNYPKLHEGVILMHEPEGSSCKTGQAEILKRKFPSVFSSFSTASEAGTPFVKEIPTLTTKGEIVVQEIYVIVTPRDSSDTPFLLLQLLEFVISKFPNEDDNGTVFFNYSQFEGVIEDIAKTRPGVTWTAFIN